MIKIIQSSYPDTGFTLLLNLIHGFISPQEKIHYDTSSLIHEFLITKTHNTNITQLENTYLQYKLFFIMSERNDSKIQAKINNEYKNKSNVLVINYDKLLETYNSIKDIIDYIFNEFNNFMEERLNLVNEMVKLMKDKPFSEWDRFTGIHGSHKNRK